MIVEVVRDRGKVGFTMQSVSRKGALHRELHFYARVIEDIHTMEEHTSHTNVCMNRVTGWEWATQRTSDIVSMRIMQDLVAGVPYRVQKALCQAYVLAHRQLWSVPAPYSLVDWAELEPGECCDYELLVSRHTYEEREAIMAYWQGHPQVAAYLSYTDAKRYYSRWVANDGDKLPPLAAPNKDLPRYKPR